MYRTKPHYHPEAEEASSLAPKLHHPCFDHKILCLRLHLSQKSGQLRRPRGYKKKHKKSAAQLSCRTLVINIPAHKPMSASSIASSHAPKPSLSKPPSLWERWKRRRNLHLRPRRLNLSFNLIDCLFLCRSFGRRLLTQKVSCVPHPRPTDLGASSGRSAKCLSIFSTIGARIGIFFRVQEAALRNKPNTSGCEVEQLHWFHPQMPDAQSNGQVDKPGCIKQDKNGCRARVPRLHQLVRAVQHKTPHLSEGKISQRGCGTCSCHLGQSDVEGEPVCQCWCWRVRLRSGSHLKGWSPRRIFLRAASSSACGNQSTQECSPPGNHPNSSIQGPGSRDKDAESCPAP